MQLENLSVISISLHSVYPREKLFFSEHPGLGFLLMYLNNKATETETARDCSTTGFQTGDCHPTIKNI